MLPLLLLPPLRLAASVHMLEKALKRRHLLCRSAEFSALLVVTAGAAVPRVRKRRAPASLGDAEDIRRCIGRRLHGQLLHGKTQCQKTISAPSFPPHAVEQSPRRDTNLCSRAFATTARTRPSSRVSGLAPPSSKPDGEVVVNAERCAGCAYCVQACPYDARAS